MEHLTYLNPANGGNTLLPKKTFRRKLHTIPSYHYNLREAFSTIHEMPIEKTEAFFTILERKFQEGLTTFFELLGLKYLPIHTAEVPISLISQDGTLLKASQYYSRILQTLSYVYEDSGHVTFPIGLISLAPNDDFTRKIRRGLYGKMETLSPTLLGYPWDKALWEEQNILFPFGENQLYTTWPQSVYEALRLLKLIEKTGAPILANWNLLDLENIGQYYAQWYTTLKDQPTDALGTLKTLELNGNLKAIIEKLRKN